MTSNIHSNLLPTDAFHDGAEFACEISVYINPEQARKKSKMPDDIRDKMIHSFQNKDMYGYSKNSEMSQAYHTHASRIRTLAMHHSLYLCFKINPDFMLGAITIGHMLIVATTMYNGIRYLTGFMVITIEHDVAKIDLICSDTRLKYVGQSLILFFKKLCYRLLDRPISASSVENKYTQKFYFDQYFVRVPEPKIDKFILYIWVYNNENADDVYNIDNFTAPFMAIKSADFKKQFNDELPTETRKTYFKMLGPKKTKSKSKSPSPNPPKTKTKSKSKSPSPNPPKTKTKSKSKSPSPNPPKTKSNSKSPSLNPPKTKSKSKSKSPSPKTSTVKHRKIHARF